MMNSLDKLFLVAERILSSPGDRLDSADFIKESVDHENKCPSWMEDHSYVKRPPTILNIDDVGVGGNANVFTTSLDAAAESWEGSVTRCICEFQHDDGYMICCDLCNVWQHVDCMGVDRCKIPDVYLCELCEPRETHKVLAILTQQNRIQVLPTLLDSYKSKVKRIPERKLSQSNEILDSANSESEVDGVKNRLESSPYPSRSSSFHSGQIMMSTSATQLDASQGQCFAKKHWLRQAINESSDTSSASVSMSRTTPLKKRRLTVDSQGENNLSQYPAAQKFEWTETGGFHLPSPPMPERQIEVGLAHQKNSAKDNLAEQSTVPVNNAGGLPDALVIAHPIGVEYEHDKSTIGGPVGEVCLNMRTDAVQNIKNYELDSRGRVNDDTKETSVLDRKRKPSQMEVKQVSSLVAGNRQLETSPPFDRELAYNKKLDETSVTEPTSSFSNDSCKLKQNPAYPSPCDFEVSTTDLTLGSSDLDSAFGKRQKTHFESEPGDPTVTCSSATEPESKATMTMSDWNMAID